MLRTMIARLGAFALIAGLLVFASSGPAQAREFHPWGSATSKDHVLKRGCHDYTYRYHVDPPTDQWSAEILVVGPHHLGLGSTFVDSAIDRARGKRQITVCRNSAPFGTYRLKMRVTWSTYRANTVGDVAPTTFRFVRPRSAR